MIGQIVCSLIYMEIGWYDQIVIASDELAAVVPKRSTLLDVYLTKTRVEMN